MTKIFNKFFYYVKNLILPFLMLATIYIVLSMFQRLGKEPFGANFFEFIEVILPYLVLIILLLINTFLKQDEVRNDFFYNVTSFLAIATIFIFCYRAMFDKNLILWHKLKYDIDFNYFTDQIAPMKTMLYMLSAANVMLLVRSYLKEDRAINIETKEEVKVNEEIELNEKDSLNSNNNINNKPNKNNNNKNYYYNKNKKNNYYKNNYYKKNNNYKNKPNQNNNNNKPKKTFDFYE